MAKKRASRPTSASKQSAAPRQLAKPVYKSFSLQKRIKPPPATTLSAFRLLRQTLRVLAKNWKVFGGIVLVYGVLNALLVQSFSAFDNLDEAKKTFDSLFGGTWGQVVSGAGLFAYLVGASGNNSSATAGVYQAFLTLLFSLVLIWVYREVYADHPVKVRDGFYKGMTPLVPFVLVMLVVGLQLLPFSVGGLLYVTVMAGDIAVTSVEQMLWALLLCVTAVISLYMLASSLFALYIVTLPNMTPLRALRSARQLVYQRRWRILRKIIFLPVVLLVMAGAVIMPLILFATPLAPWAFFAMSTLLLPTIHGYMYALYRSLL